MPNIRQLVSLVVVASLLVLVTPAGAPAASSAVAWKRVFGQRDSYTRASDVACDLAGNVYVVGTVLVRAPGHGMSAITNVFVRKYSPAGRLMWGRRFGGAGGMSSGASVAADKSGRCYVGGTWSTQDARELTRDLAFVRAYSASGQVRWTRYWRAFDGAKAVALSPSAADLYAASNRGDDDIIVRRYASGGTLRRWVRVPTGGRSATGDLSVDPSGRVYVCGTAGRGNAGGSCYVRKMSSGLVTLWTRTWNLWDHGGGISSGSGLMDSVADATGVWATGWIEPDTSTPLGNSIVMKYSAGGGLVSAETTGAGPFSGLAKDAYSLYAVGATLTAGSGLWQVHKYDRSWAQVGWWTAGPAGTGPEGCATDRFRNLIVVGSQAGRPTVIKFRR